MDKFVNRTEDSKEVKRLLSTQERVHIIYSTAGTGKSSLILHVLKNYASDRFIIIPSEELIFSNRADKFYFAEKICDCLFEILDINVIKKFLYRFIDHSVKFGTSVTAIFATLNLEFNRQFSIMQECVIDCLKGYEKPLIIYLENVHKIDYHSLQFIIRIIRETSSVNFVFEYQTDIIGDVPSDIISQLQQSRIGVNCWEIKMLDWNHVCEILKNSKLPLLKDSRKDYYTSNGNLKKLLAYNAFINNKDIDLEDDHLFLLEFISMTQGELGCQEISTIISKYPGSNDYFLPLIQINEYISDLLDYELIGKLKEKLYITTSGLQYRNKTKDDLIIEMLSSYYIPLINNQNNNACLQGLKILLPIFTKNADDRISKLLPSLSRNIYPLRCNKTIIDDIYAHIDSNPDNDDIRAILIRIYIQLGNYNDAYKKVKAIEYRGNDTIKILYATLLSHLYPNEETEYIINNLLNDVGTEAKSALYTCLVALFMKTREKKIVLEYVEEVKKIGVLTEVDANIIDKNISIYFGFENAKKMLLQTSKYFKNNNMITMRIATCITMAMRLAQNGSLTKAQTLLNIISKSSHLSELDYMYISNNNAVINLLSGKENNTTLRNLKNAYYYIQDEYTKLLVTNNLLIYHTIHHNFDIAKQFAEELEEVGFSIYKFEDYLHLTYLNLRFYYKTIDRNRFELYSNKLKELEQLCSESELSQYIKSHFETIIFAENQRWHFMSNFQFRPAFLGHWIINNFDY